MQQLPMIPQPPILLTDEQVRDMPHIPVMEHRQTIPIQSHLLQFRLEQIIEAISPGGSDLTRTAWALLEFQPSQQSQSRAFSPHSTSQ